MTFNEILSAAESLSEAERQSLITSLSSCNHCEAVVPESSRLLSLLDKRGHCPHCGSSRYYRFGKDKGTQRFRCKDCGRTFTEYTGTWQQQLHKKEAGKHLHAVNGRTEITRHDFHRIAHQQEYGL